MKIQPFIHKIHSPWERTRNHAALYSNNCLKILIFHMKMGRIVLAHIHINGDTIKIADFRHNNDIFANVMNFRITRTIHHAKAENSVEFSAFVAGAGLEPTTSGL